MDNSAKSLLEQLKETKSNLIANRKIMDKKDKHIYPITDIPFTIPETWIWAYLSDISIIQEGPGIRKHQYQNEGVQFLTVTNILEGSVDLEKSKKFISNEEYENKYSHFTINKGDIVTACSGGSWGKSAIFEYDYKIILNTSTLRLRFFNDLGCNKYLYYLTKTDYFKKSLSSYSTGQQPNYGYYHYSRIPIPIPPLPEQKRIVSILDRAFEAIDKAKAHAEQNLKNARELFESYLQGVFENNNWKKEQIKYLTSLVTKGSSPNWQGVNYVDSGGIFFLTSKNVGEGELLLNNKKYLEEKFNDIQKTSILKKGDVLTNIVGASIGRTAIFDLEEITNINQAVCLMRCKPEKIYNYYLMYLLNSPFFKNILHDNEVDNARANLSLTFFKNLSIPLPKLSEQKEIVENINSFSAETKKLEAVYQQKLVNLEELKKSILQKAFRGEL